MQIVKGHFQLIWADKFALAVAAAGVFVALLLWVLVAVAAGTLGANHVFATLGMASIFYTSGAALLLWLVLRAIDFAAKGATYTLIKGEQFPATDKHVPPAPLVGAA
jgi:hypothetical protein